MPSTRRPSLSKVPSVGAAATLASASIMFEIPFRSAVTPEPLTTVYARRRVLDAPIRAQRIDTVDVAPAGRPRGRRRLPSWPALSSAQAFYEPNDRERGARRRAERIHEDARRGEARDDEQRRQQRTHDGALAKLDTEVEARDARKKRRVPASEITERIRETKAVHEAEREREPR